MPGFVNPYTFVPFPVVDADRFRRAPAGHARLGSDESGSPRLMGRVEVVLTARSPLLVRDRAGRRFPRRAAADGDGEVPYLPGSGLAGVVRSLYEMLAGGCLRVFDEGYLPTYRDGAVSRGDDWTLALVERVDGNGRPVRLRLCETVVRVPSRWLRDVLGEGQVRTGQRVTITDYRPGGRGLPTVTDRGDVSGGDDWVVLVTDASTRDGATKTYYCTVGKLRGDDGVLECGSDEFRWAQRWAPAWDEFMRCVEDSEDVRQARGDPQKRGPLHPTSAPVTAPVCFTPKKGGEPECVGYRHQARTRLFPDQVLWVRPNRDHDGVEEFALSAIWRHSGQGPAWERVPEALLACANPERLCPTCRVFGSVDARREAGDVERAEQSGYRGHVRFSDARPVDGSPTVEKYSLAPLGRPRPGAGQFYLEPPAPRVRPGKDEEPLREWGSRADQESPRSLRGRKRYWLTEQYRSRPLFRVHDGPFDSEMAISNGEAVAAGTRFAFTVWFEGLDVTELGALLAALDPALLLSGYVDDGMIGYAVGGGRPLGFGTCTSEIIDLQVQTAASRYSTGEAPQVGVDQALATFRRTVDGGVRATWPAAARALHLDHAPPDHVWYPTTGTIQGEGPLSKDDLAPDFEFWRHSAGYATKNQRYDLVPLPNVTDDDQHVSQPEARDTNRDTNRGKNRRRKGNGRR